MQNCSVRAVLILLLMGATQAPAASQLTKSQRASLVESDGIPRTSVGASLEMIERDLDMDGRTTGRLESTAYYGFLGYDLRPWLKAFATAGAVEADRVGPSTGGAYDSDLRWSLGLSANLWHVDVRSPDYLRGRLSIALETEYISNEASSTSADAEWTEIRAVLPFGFEIPNEPMSFWGVNSLYLYAGPIYSALDGEVTASGRRTDVESSDELGATVGADIFAAPNLSFGAQILYLDDVSITASVRFHF